MVKFHMKKKKCKFKALLKANICYPRYLLSKRFNNYGEILKQNLGII